MFLERFSLSFLILSHRIRAMYAQAAAETALLPLQKPMESFQVITPRGWT